MRWFTVVSVIIFLIAGIAVNSLYFKFSAMPFIGTMLLALVILAVVVNFAGKANKKRKGIQGEPDAFIFPDKTAKKLKKMDLGVQYEASVISSALLMLGIVLFLIYFIFFTSSSWVMKGLIIFNSVCGLGLMGGMMVTYYQQLVAYRESTKFLQQYAQSPANSRLVGGSVSTPTNYGSLPADAYSEEGESLYDDEPYESQEEYLDYNQQMKGGIRR